MKPARRKPKRTTRRKRHPFADISVVPDDEEREAIIGTPDEPAKADGSSRACERPGCA